MPNEKIAAIDIGSNSFHIVIAEINPETQSFKILDTLKETVRLGHFNTPSKELDKKNMNRGFETLKRFAKLAEGRNVTEIFASATSAVRESPNGREWLKEVKDELGIDAHIISGVEEARLIYLGVLSSLELKNRRVAIIDIGGGSTELICGDEQFIYHLSSSKVGAVRLSETNLSDESDIDLSIKKTEKLIEGMILTKIQEFQNSSKYDFLVGTSGTIKTICKIDLQMNSLMNRDSESSLDNYKVSYDSLIQIIEKMKSIPKKDRAEAFGISKSRAEIILAGALILKVYMEKLDAKEITYCDRALREGLLVDKLLQKGIIINRLKYQQTIRERSIDELANKYNYNKSHADQVIKLVTMIFDQTKNILHNYSDQEKELLIAAAKLHDIGSWISHNDHHKHTYYLIKHNGLLGYNIEETAIIANIARYHRQSPPKEFHSNYEKLPREHKKIVRDLSSFLRIAEGLDKGHKSAVESLNICNGNGKNKLKFNILSSIKGYDCSLELWSAEGKSKEFQKEFDIEVSFKLEKGT